MQFIRQQQSEQPSFIPYAVLFSVSLHIILATFYWSSLKSIRSAQIPENIYSVELIAPIEKIAPKENKQIVESNNKITVPNEKIPAFQAERDNFSTKQQIKRGEELSSNIHSKAENPDPATSAKESVKKPAISKNLNLKLAPADLADIYEHKKPAQDQAQENLQEAINKQNNPKIAAGVDVSRLGSRDFLADIPDGEVTLLNAKANKFAVFVRRVAAQVFANLKGSGWQSLSPNDINQIEKEAVFEAVLSAKGELIAVSQINKSGSLRFDQVLDSSIRRGAKDPNPPNGAAAEDGMIHFTFQAKSWVQVKTNPRTGSPVQRRWLLLGTGLE